MKIAGTLKCEIIRPEAETWDDVGSRLRALRDTLAPALNETMRVLYPAAMAWIQAMRDKNKSETKLKSKWQNTAKKELLARWKLEMERRLSFELKRNPEVNQRAFAPPLDFLSDRELVLARFKGQPLKDLLASRASIPSWRNGAAFYAEGRKCEIHGTPDAARLLYPLWGSGSRATMLRVAPCGNNHRKLWRALVEGEFKTGRVGISYCNRKKKWYALISWTGEKDVEKVEGQKAGCNFGANVFLQVVAEDGSSFRVDGSDILVTRKRFAHRRFSVQKSLDTMGCGSRGHGRKRRLLPLTKLEDAESRWATTKCRMVAAELIKWCVRHRVGTLYLEDLEGVRDTVGDTHANVSRLIHQWPFYELRMAVERQAAEFGVTVTVKAAAYNSQRCPKCSHVAEENTKTVNGRTEHLVYKGKAWSRADRRRVFECVACAFKADGDVVAASNLLAESSGDVAQQVKSKGRKSARKSTMTAIATKD